MRNLMQYCVLKSLRPNRIEMVPGGEKQALPANALNHDSQYWRNIIDPLR